MILTENHLQPSVGTHSWCSCLSCCEKVNGTANPACLARFSNLYIFSTSAECDSPDPLNNGDVDVSNDGLTASYTCNLGYSLNGHISRSCSIDGSWWSGSKPNCCMFVLSRILFLFTLYQTNPTFNPCPNKPWFLHVCSTSLLKTLW